jgi:hypothetical protein
MKRKKKIIKIKIKVGKPSIGHQSHITGTGVHDNRPRKQRTRSSQNNRAIREFS